MIEHSWTEQLHNSHALEGHASDKFKRYSLSGIFFGLCFRLVTNTWNISMKHRMLPHSWIEDGDMVHPLKHVVW
jgi:hypothetical protein